MSDPWTDGWPDPPARLAAVEVEPPQQRGTADLLPFRSLADLCRDVDAAGPRRWLIRGIWPAGAYGVHAAEPKAGKTWNALDLAVSVASGTPWLGRHPRRRSRPVRRAARRLRVRPTPRCRGPDPGRHGLVQRGPEP